MRTRRSTTLLRETTTASSRRPFSGRIDCDAGWHSRLNIQSDRAHQLDAVALGDDSAMQHEIEMQLAVDEFVLEMHIPESAVIEPGNIREREIMGPDQPNCPPLDQAPYDAFRADPPVRRVGPLQQFIQQKQQ